MPDDTGPHSVGGTVSGVWSGVMLDLRLEATGFPPETIRVESERAFAFATLLPTGTPYVVVIDGDVPRHTCGIASGVGTATAPVNNIAVTCDDQVGLDLRLSWPVALAINPSTLTAPFDVSTLQRGLRVSLQSPAGAEATVTPGSVNVNAPPNGQPANPTLPIPIPYGTTGFLFRVSSDGLNRDFERVMRRGAANIEQYKYAKASNVEGGDLFGTSVDLGDEYEEYTAIGEIAVIGAPGEDGSTNSFPDSGAVYVFDVTGASFANSTSLKPSSVAALRGFGNAVSLGSQSGATVLVVGASGDDALGTDAGAAYIFRKTLTGWTQEARLTAPSGAAANDRFGFSVSTDGTGSVAIGAPGHAGTGAAFIYRRTTTAWVLDRTITAPNAGIGDEFGWAVCASNGGVIASAPGEDSATVGSQTTASADNDAPESGAVYMIDQNGALQAYVKSSSSSANDRFGTSLSRNRNWSLGFDSLIVGAPGDLVLGSSVGGAAYVFNGTTGAWVENAVLTPHVSTAGGDYASSVSLNGDLAVVTTRMPGGNPGTGVAELFRMSGTSWTHVINLTGLNAEVGDEFGTAVALSYDKLIVTAVQESSSSMTDMNLNDAPGAGAAYVFR